MTITSAIVNLAAFPIGALKFLAVFLKELFFLNTDNYSLIFNTVLQKHYVASESNHLKVRFPALSAFHALMRAKSPVIASSIINCLSLNVLA